MCVSNERARVSVEYLCQCAPLLCSYVDVHMWIYVSSGMWVCQHAALCVHMGVYMCQHCVHVCVNVSVYA